MLRGHAPESGKRECRGHIVQTEIGSPVAFAAKGENRVRTGVHGAVYTSREMHAEKRKLWIRHRVDESPHQGRTLRKQMVVFAAKGNNHHVRVCAGHARDAVAEQSGAVDEISCGKYPAPAFDHNFTTKLPQARHHG